jgi:hypothetical protein
MQKIYKILLLLLSVTSIYASGCKVINSQCLDYSPTKTIGGITYKLSDACAANGLSGSQCCWDQKQRYYCGDATDECQQYRSNANCKFIKNDCKDKDPITGNCLKYQSTYQCANSYRPVESQVCTDAICVNNNNDTNASSCFLPNGTQIERDKASKRNTGDLISVISILEMGKQAGDDTNINCPSSDPKSCMIFQGQYYTCKIWQFSNMPNNGSDCVLHNQYFSPNSAGINASDKAVYGSTAMGKTSYDYSSNSPNFDSTGMGIKVGDQFNYSLSNNDSRYINKSVINQQQNNLPIKNPDLNIPYNPNARNQTVSMANGQVISVTVANSAANKIGFWHDYLTADTIKLAWNRKKASPNPNDVKTVTFQDMGIGRRPNGNAGAWGDDKPFNIQGLCVYLANSCDGGDDKGTNSIPGKLITLGNANGCTHCTNELLGECITAEPNDVNEEWCCYNSKIAMDINLAAYDQGLIDLYNGSVDKYKGGGNVKHNGSKCGGLTIEQLSKIDFSKGNYFNDFISQIDINKFMNNDALQSNVARGSMQNRGGNTATKIVKNKGN